MGTASLPIDLLRWQVLGTDLTPKEREVMRLLALGYQQPEIAAKRGVSLETVRKQTKIARARLGARTNAQAVGIAVSLDII